jgi:hypothetical protein
MQRIFDNSVKFLALIISKIIVIVIYKRVFEFFQQTLHYYLCFGIKTFLRKKTIGR